MNKIVFVIILSLLLFVPITPAVALRPRYVYDEYDLLNPSQEEGINDFLCTVDDQTTCEIVFVIESYTAPQPDIFTKALEYFEDIPLDGVKGIGKEGKDNGVLVILTMKDGDAFIMTGYGVEGDLTDSECGRIIDNILVPNLNDYKDFDAIMKTAEAIAEELGYEEAEPETVETKSEITEKEFIIIAGLAITLVLIVFIIQKYLERKREQKMREYREEQLRLRKEREKKKAELAKKQQEDWWATRPIRYGYCPKCETQRKTKQVDTKRSEILIEGMWWAILFYSLKCLTCGTIFNKEYNRKEIETAVARTARLALEAKRREEQRKRDEERRKRREREEEESRRYRSSSSRSSSRSSYSSGGSFGGGRTGGGGAGGGFRPR